jgi:hypothetical protein
MNTHQYLQVGLVIVKEINFFWNAHYIYLLTIITGRTDVSKGNLARYIKYRKFGIKLKSCIPRDLLM